jgi:antitoxin component YwqK of YwqJK toxin-antitoxin module
MTHIIDIIKDHYNEYIDIDDNIVFSSVNNFIIIIKLLDDSLTDDNEEERPDIIDKQYACYHTNKAIVLVIIDKFNPISKITSMSFNKNNYIVGNIIISDKKIISYYKCIEPAYTINLNGIKSEKYKVNGYIKQYHFNGILFVEGELKDGIEIGLWKYYNKKGLLIKEITFNNGNFGTVYVYDSNDDITEKHNIVNYMKHGDYIIYKNKKINIHGYYTNGCKDKDWKYYDDDEKLIRKETYDFGNIIGQLKYK